MIFFHLTYANPANERDCRPPEKKPRVFLSLFCVFCPKDRKGKESTVAIEGGQVHIPTAILSPGTLEIFVGFSAPVELPAAS